MIVNNLQNPYAINEIYASKPLKNESSSLSANSMPTNNRVISETGVPKRALIIHHLISLDLCMLIINLPVMAHLQRVL